MLKTIIYLTVFLLVFGLVFSVLDYKGEYLAEKKLLSANKLFFDLSKNPESIPPALYEKTANSFKSIISGYPETQSAKRARLILAKLYTFEKKFDMAREELNKILTNYPNDKGYCSEALFAVGNSYENEGKWNKALPIYENIIDNYIGTLKALNMPIYIANYYAKNKDTINRDAYLKKALTYYREISQQNPNTQLGYLAMDFEIVTLQFLARWDEALEALQAIINAYPRASKLTRHLQMIGAISLFQLKQPQRVIDIYNDFIEKHPRHRLSKFLLKQIKLIKNKVKEQDNDVKRPDTP